MKKEQTIKVKFSKENSDKVTQEWISMIINAKPCFISPEDGRLYNWDEVNLIWIDDENTDKEMPKL